MTLRETILNIAVNMGRLSRYSQQKNLDRIETFLNDNEQYIRELEMSQLSELIKPTIKESLFFTRKDSCLIV